MEECWKLPTLDHGHVAKLVTNAGGVATECGGGGEQGGSNGEGDNCAGSCDRKEKSDDGDRIVKRK